MTIKELNNMLALKLQKEMASYKQDLLKQKPEEIVLKSFETLTKEELIDIFSYKDLEKEEIQALLKENNILDTLWERWHTSDGKTFEGLEDNVEISIGNIKEKYQNERKKQRER